MLAWVLHVVPLTDILRVLGSAHPGYVVLGFGLQMLVRLPTALRMKMIADAQNLALSLATIFLTLFSTSFYGLLLPGALTGGAVTWMKYVGHGAKAGPALVSIVVNRTSELLTVAVAGIAYWVMDRYLSGAAAIGFALLTATFLLCIYLLLFGRSHYVSLLVQHGARIGPLARSFLYGKLSAFAHHLARMRELPRRTVVWVLLTTLLQDLLSVAGLYAFSRALDLELAFLTVAWMRAAIHFVVLLPLSLSGLGVREGMLVLLTAPFGIAASSAVAWSFLVFAGTLLAALGGGLVEARALWSDRHAPPRSSRDESV